MPRSAKPLCNGALQIGMLLLLQEFISVHFLKIIVAVYKYSLINYSCDIKGADCIIQVLLASSLRVLFAQSYGMPSCDFPISWLVWLACVNHHQQWSSSRGPYLGAFHSLQDNCKCVCSVDTGSRLTCVTALLPKEMSGAESKVKDRKKNRKRTLDASEGKKMAGEMDSSNGSKRTVVQHNAEGGKDKSVKKKKHKAD